MSPKNLKLRPIWRFTIFLRGFFREKIFIVIFAYFSHKKNLIKKNTQKCIFYVQFPAEPNPAGRIRLNSDEKPENCKNTIFIEQFITQKLHFQID